MKMLPKDSWSRDGGFFPSSDCNRVDLLLGHLMHGKEQKQTLETWLAVIPILG